jgi:hypothetical protein
MEETCPVCGKEVRSGIRIGGVLYHYECFPPKALGKAKAEVEAGVRVGVCSLLKGKFMGLLEEVRREPERLKRRMAEAEEKLRLYRDRIFDEYGRLIDPLGLKKALLHHVEVSQQNIRILLAKMETLLELAEELKCAEAAEMRGLHDREAMPVLVSVIPEILRGLDERFPS